MKAANRINFKEIFGAAINLPPSERKRFLARACADDKMRDEIERLLAADEAAGSFLESSPFDESAKDSGEMRAQNYAGQKIGAYRIEREIGAGGMGTVFLAERDLGDVRQKVAVKIVHQGAFSKEIICRFLIERKILARLEHSGIARLIDAGETNEGLPFLVMEYVEGKSLDEYCRAGNFSIDERLQLFRNICAAVAYAHRRLIVHRDLKPSNVLVTAAGEPKLLDFGIAKLLAPVDAAAPQTATLMNLLTPAYAAPEQIRGEAVTTATDVYSLGVILYELLTGVRPFYFGSKNYQEIVRVICETEPPKPSAARTLENKTAQTDKNKNHSTENNSISRFKINNAKSLRGDLDNIILKSLRKDPERRYQSVLQLSEDIERYLKGLPVSARPDTFLYRSTKFFERHQAAVVSFSIILLLLVGGIFSTTWQAVRAARQQKIAEQRFAQVRKLANNVIFKYHDSIANLSGSTEVRQMLVEDATKYLNELSQDSDADENLQNELALAYAKLADVQGKPYYANTGDTAGAMENYRKSIKLLENLSNSKDAVKSEAAEEELIATYHSYSSLNSRIFNVDEAIFSQKKALDLANKHLLPDAQNLKRQMTFARANLWLGDAYSEAGNFPEAINYYRLTVELADELYQKAPDEKDAETTLGVAHDRIGRSQLLRGQELARTDFPPPKIAEIYRESYAHLEKTLELFKKVADNNPDNQKYQRNYIDGQCNAGIALRNIGEFDRSLKVLQKVADDTGRKLEKDHGNRELQFDNAGYVYQLALSLNAKNEFAASVKKLQSAMQTINQLIAEDADNIQFRRSRLEMTNDYGNLFLKKNDVSSALKIYQTELKQLSQDEKPFANAFTSFAEGMMNENIGDCYAQMSHEPLASKTQRETDLKKSQTYYRNAVNLWQMPEVKRSYLSRTPEMLEYLNRKL